MSEEIEKLIQRERELSEYSGADRVVPVAEHLERKKQESFNRIAYSSSFDKFDEAIEGFQTGEVAIISGPTGNGKTLFAGSWIKGMMDRHVELRPVILSFEVNTQQFFEKYLPRPFDGCFCPDELKDGIPEWVIERIWEANLKYGCRLAVIDHLHYVVDMNTKQNMSLNIGAFLRSLKILARRLNVAIILIAHQGQPPKEKGGEEASISNIRDSSFIGQEADLVFMVIRRKNFSVDELVKIQERGGFEQREKIQSRANPEKDPGDEYGDGFAVVKIEKARRAGTYRRKMLFHKSGGGLEQV